MSRKWGFSTGSIFHDREEKVNTVRLQNLSYGHKQSAALTAAIMLHLFTCISQGATSIPDIAGAAGISGLNAERLLVACTVIRLI